MSDMLFDLDPEGVKRQDERIRSNLSSDITPSVFQNLGGAVGNAVMRGAAQTGRTLALAAAVPSIAIEKAGGLDPNSSNAVFKAVNDWFNPAIDYWTPNARETGAGSHIVGALIEGIEPLALGGAAGVPLMLANAQFGTSTDLVRQDVKADTALKVGLAAGVSNALGFKIPFVGNALATRMASGAAGNLAVNTAATAVQKATLEGDGHYKAAEAYNPADTTGRLLDIAIGAAFGVVHHVTTPVKTVQSDAVLAVRNAKNFQEDSAPGLPKDIESSSAHQANMEEAMMQLARGDRVDLSETLQPAEFVNPGPKLERLAQDVQELVTGQKNEVIPRGEGLTEHQQSIEREFSDKVIQDFEGAKKEYNAIKDTDDGKVLNTDLARELSPEYRSDRTQSVAVHEPASWFVKRLYAEKLAELPQNSDILFTAGGTGAGKTTALEGIPEMAAASRNAGLVYDTNMNGLKSSIQKIEQALDAGHNVKVVMVDRDPVEALVKGALPRAERIGRTVPLNEHYKTHRDVPIVMQELQKRYADNPRFSMSIVDNTRGKGNSALTSLDKLPQRDYNLIERQLHDALEHEYQSGHIKESIYRGTLPTGSLGSDHPQGIPAGLPEGNRSPNRHPDGSGEGNQPNSMESANGRGNAQVDTGAAAGLPGNDQGREGGHVQDGGVRPDDSQAVSAGVTAQSLLSQFKTSGGDFGQFFSTLADTSPEVKNLLIGMHEAGTPERIKGLIDDFQRSSQAFPDRASQDVAADVVEAHRSGRTLTQEAKIALPPTPEVDAMRQMAAENPRAEVIEGYDADGNPMKRPVGEVIADIEAEHQAQLKEAESYGAAVNCFIRRGG